MAMSNVDCRGQIAEVKTAIAEVRGQIVEVTALDASDTGEI
jgi:hypothetical protein